MKKTRVGVVGCGNISPIYFSTLPKMAAVEVAACADMIPERAEASAKKYNVPKACSVKELLDDQSIDIVLNLTIPKAHCEVALAALKAGKHVYGEKPLALTRADGLKIVNTAAKKKRLVGSAPDTFFGAGIQTCRKLIDDGAIGKPVAATAFMTCRGHERWHPDPEFYYKPGGGPMLDMGPYYITALVNLLGPVKRVSGSARASFPERTITSEKKNGQKIAVEVSTNYSGSLDFADGTICTMIMSFDIWTASLPAIEIYGSEGTLSVPDPNSFGGPVKLFKSSTQKWEEIPLAFGYAGNSRGVGVADMACAIQSGRSHRASGELAMHVLDVMLSFDEASKSGKAVMPGTTCKRPAALPPGLKPGELDV